MLLNDTSSALAKRVRRQKPRDVAIDRLKASVSQRISRLSIPCSSNRRIPTPRDTPAKARDAVLITHNASEFARVPDLRAEDWQRAHPKKA